MTGTHDDPYFHFVRREIAPLLPAKASRILEIGCASGHTLAWLKGRWPEAETVGVDGYAGIEEELRSNVDRALIHDLEQPLPDLGRFDLILALDVLEHLRQPGDVLGSLVERLEPHGAVIVSVPNVANYGILLGLLRRRFRYTDAGILDRTHLRFFTEESVLALMRDAGLNVTGGVMTGFWKRKVKLADAITFGLARHYLASQYVVRGEKGPGRRFGWGRF